MVEHRVGVRFGDLQRAGTRSWRWTTEDSARLIVPFLMPEPHRITMPIAANVGPGESLFVQIGCNGTLVATAFVGAGWTSIVFDTDGTVGESVIEIVAIVQPHRTGEMLKAGFGVPAPLPGASGLGVAVGPLNVALP